MGLLLTAAAYAIPAAGKGSTRKTDKKHELAGTVYDISMYNMPDVRGMNLRHDIEA